MSVLKSIRSQIVPIHPEGYIFIAISVFLAMFLGWLWSPLGWVGAILSFWCITFFRDPPRVTPLRDGLVVAPADGIVSSIGFFVPPPELGLGDQPLQRISIFMSVFNCHVNRAPISGRISRLAYKPGLFLSADMDKASEDNERSGMVLETSAGQFGVVQIAGLVARRIVSFVHEGDRLNVGDRFGLIRFGSRVDVYMPGTVRPQVGLGTKAVAGETILADLNSEEVARSFKVG
ncbi:MAG: phosphatidylserine decarboxylase [Hyphomicrobiales bacterium]|nr:phosphatidylserine decarboxylase [Hyphomicrobiales bacterium]MDE2114683.1 phosphatidylserine decarboxylase [Hyphomicrobiales bacterium]